jgi:hypothetical protein
MNINNNLFWLQKWYYSQCDGDWEHEFGITIKTVDNPGWYLTINLKGTECEGVDFQSIQENRNEESWYFCLVRDYDFIASCGPCDLNAVLQIFRNWVEKIKP